VPKTSEVQFTPSKILEFLELCIVTKYKGLQQEKTLEKEFWEKEEKKIEDEKRKQWMKDHVEKTKIDPFSVISLKKPPTKTTIQIRKQNHSGYLIPIRWVSGKGNQYVDNFYSCCGLREEEPSCNIPNWSSEEQDFVHFGELYLYSSKKQPGGRGPTGSSRDHIPICKIPKWTCCSKYSYEPGCKDN